MDHMSAAVTAVATAPFTVRAQLEPYRIQQLPNFQIHSKATSDIVMQQSVFNPGPGPWHTHPGPSFVYVVEGEIKLERHSRQDGCTETPVYGAGQAYFEVADEVHRAVVMSATPAVVLVTRFNIPVGGPVTIPAAAPDCTG
jgi:quercetin dioxygenase-like cupin family protein